MSSEKERLQKELRDFYKDKPFYNGLLHETCEWRAECWKGISDDNPAKKGAVWNYFSEPYIGEKYTGELVCVGLNVHTGGGRNLQTAQIEGGKNITRHESDQFIDKYEPGVRDCLREGTFNKIFYEGMKRAGQPNYSTFHWHRMAVYAATLLGGWSENLMQDRSALADVFERIVYMDVVKCSPNNKKSEPTGMMKQNCAFHIFLEEIKILKPETLLMCDHEAAQLLREKCMPEKVYFPGTNKPYNYCRMTVGDRVINVFYIWSPNYAGYGNRKDLPGKFAEFVREINHEAN